MRERHGGLLCGLGKNELCFILCCWGRFLGHGWRHIMESSSFLGGKGWEVSLDASTGKGFLSRKELRDELLDGKRWKRNIALVALGNEITERVNLRLEIYIW
jgi:hypothetical protein